MSNLHSDRKVVKLGRQTRCLKNNNKLIKKDNKMNIKYKDNFMAETNEIKGLIESGQDCTEVLGTYMQVALGSACKGLIDNDTFQSGVTTIMDSIASSDLSDEIKAKYKEELSRVNQEVEQELLEEQIMEEIKTAKEQTLSILGRAKALARKNKYVTGAVIAVAVIGAALLIRNKLSKGDEDTGANDVVIISGAF